MPSPMHAERRWSRSRRGSMLRRDLHNVVASEPVGPYTLLRVARGDLEPGIPGQFFMLEAPGRVLPRPMSLSLAPPGELGFLFEAIGPGTNALAELEPGDRIGILGPLGNGFCLDVDRPLLVGGGIGVAPFPYLSQTLDRPDALGRARAGAGGPAGLGGAHGLRVRRLLRLHRRDRRALQTPVPGGSRPCCLTPPAASMRWRRPTWPAPWMPSSRRP